MKEKRQFNGFFANNYVTNGLSSGATMQKDTSTSVTLTDNTYTKKETGLVNSSYFNNFVTPVQRRINDFPEYVMEVCPKLPVYNCEPNDWIVDWELDSNGGIIYDRRMYDISVSYTHLRAHET